jgi:hypothetical protein
VVVGVGAGGDHLGIGGCQIGARSSAWFVSSSRAEMVTLTH